MMWSSESASRRSVYIETYGCQMNVLDSEVVAAILQQHRYQVTERIEEADLVTAEFRQKVESLRLSIDRALEKETVR